jgi:DNA-binding NarL/FixJ family response regulator
MKLVVVDPHTIYRRGMICCLESLSDVEEITEIAALDVVHDPALREADVVIVDPVGETRVVVDGLTRSTGASILICSSMSAQNAIVAARQPGIVGCLQKRSLTCESLVAAVRAASRRTTAPAA